MNEIYYRNNKEYEKVYMGSTTGGNSAGLRTKSKLISSLSNWRKPTQAHRRGRYVEALQPEIGCQYTCN